MNVPFFISRRYLFAKKSRNVINLISSISMFVVACVTAAMITVLSAFNGIESLVSQLFSSFDAEVSIVPARGKTIDNPDSLLQELKTIDFIRASSLSLEDDVIIRFDGQPSVATLRGVDSLFAEVTDIHQVIRNGEYQLERSGMPCAVIGYGIQSELGIPFHPTDYPVVTVSAPVRGKKLSRYKERALNTLPILMSSVFSVNAEMDVKYLIVPLSFARELLEYEKEASQIQLALVSGYRPDAAKKHLEEVLGPDYKIETRLDRNALVHQTNRSEKWATFLILSFIMVIAGFNIMASLTMLIIEKRKDIFILQSMGLTPADVRRVFSFQGLLINLIGALSGMAVGLLLCWLQAQFGLIKLYGSIVPHYPIEVRWTDVAGVLFTVLLIGSLFSILMVRYLVKRFAQ